MLLYGIGFLLLVFTVQLSKSFSIPLEKPNNISEVPICHGRTYCEHTTYYPTGAVLEELERNPHLRDYANTDEMVFSESSSELDEEPLCVSMEQIIFPKSGITKGLEWKYIVNHETLTQSVHVETCLEENKSCRVIEGFAEGYYTECKQKYIYRQLLALKEDGSISPEYFQFPASCCCHIKFLADKFLLSFKSNN
ncbi:PREDICTED: protein spaetzle [Eufriesea mexicana]|uniref:protein spaetzle n=1 Tax=Eufriesea mexicana TaxID=516756 RepID=UPI00083BF27E|nr:PREDICTED: protein spaetzle [Eufriesea mexicana]